MMNYKFTMASFHTTQIQDSLQVKDTHIIQ